MTRFEQFIIATISISVVAGFVIDSNTPTESASESHAETQAETQTKAKPAASTVTVSDVAFVEKRKIPANKKQFYSSLLPHIENENRKLASARAELLKIQKTLESKETLSKQSWSRVSELSKTYRVSNSAPTDSPNMDMHQKVIDQLLIKVDYIPASLALSQSANESAWGRSRFATEANNYFGIWCFNPGCGVVPKGRPANKTYEVTRYASAEASVTAYFTNINSHPAYADLRKIRADLRTQNKPITGTELAAGLTRYSARGDAYIEELRAMIRYNKLEGITLKTL